jgi:hypothetical protein
MTWREEQHPRWPEDTPGSRGGEFRPKGADWVSAVATAIRTPEQDLLDLIGRAQVVGRSELAGGQVAHTNKETFEDTDGTHYELVSKSYAGGFAAQNAAREVVVAAIGQALGARVPVTVLDPGDSAGWSLYMEFMDGQTALKFATVDDGFLPLASGPDYSLLTPFQTSPSGRRLGLLDLLISNTDRHAGNWLIDEDGQVAGIDHSHVHLAGRDDVDHVWLDGTFTNSYLHQEEHVDEEGIHSYRAVLDPIEDLSRDEAVRIGMRLGALLEDDEILKLLAMANDKQPHARNGVQYAQGLMRRWDKIAAMVVET